MVSRIKCAKLYALLVPLRGYRLKFVNLLAFPVSWWFNSQTPFPLALWLYCRSLNLRSPFVDVRTCHPIP